MNTKISHSRAIVEYLRSSEPDKWLTAAHILAALVEAGWVKESESSRSNNYKRLNRLNERGTVEIKDSYGSKYYRMSPSYRSGFPAEELVIDVDINRCVNFIIAQSREWTAPQSAKEIWIAIPKPERPSFNALSEQLFKLTKMSILQIVSLPCGCPGYRYPVYP